LRQIAEAGASDALVASALHNGLLTPDDIAAARAFWLEAQSDDDNETND